MIVALDKKTTRVNGDFNVTLVCLSYTARGRCKRLDSMQSS